MRREWPGRTLQPTALIHEAYVRLIDQRRVKWRNRAHFFGVAAGMMRRILVDQARARRADKRGGGWDRVTFDGDQIAGDEPRAIDILDLHESLERLGVRSEAGADRRAAVLKITTDTRSPGPASACSPSSCCMPAPTSRR